MTDEQMGCLGLIIAFFASGLFWIFMAWLYRILFHG